MRLKIIIILISMIFLLGCVDEGVKVVKVDGDAETDDINESPEENISQSGNEEQTNETQNETSSENQDNSENDDSDDSGESVETGADLTITNFFLSTIYPEPGEDFEISFKIKNAGSEDIEDFEYSIKFMEGEDVKDVDYYDYDEKLESGSSSERITKTFSLSEGQYELFVSMDPMNEYEEEDEDNNVEEQSFSVQNTGSSSGSDAYTNPSSSSSDGEDSEDDSDNTESTCYDSDDGTEYGVKGTCTDDMGNNVDDICIENNELWEWYCRDNRCQHETHTCYCQEGKCIE